MPDLFSLIIQPALEVVRLYQNKYHRVPGALVDAICDEIAKLPILFQCSIYQRILTDYADIAGHFVDAGEDDDQDDEPHKETPDDKKPATISQVIGIENQRGYQ